MKAKILVVDDNKAILDAFQRKFNCHYEILCASNGREGLELLANGGSFAVIVSDWKMPGMDGIQFLGEAMRRVPEAARIMLTGYGSRQLAEDAVGRGYLFRFLAKPCRPRDLYDAIENGISHHLAGRTILMES